MVCRQVYNSIYGLQTGLQQYLWSSSVSMVCRPVYNSICGLQASLQQYLSTIGSVAKSHQRQGLQASLGTSALCSHSRCQPNSPAQSVSQTHQQSVSQTHQNSQPAKLTTTVSQTHQQSISQTHQHSQSENYDKNDFQNFDLEPPPPPPTHRGYEDEAC